MSSFLDIIGPSMEASRTLQERLDEHNALLLSVRVQYAESALAYSLRGLSSGSSEKKPAVLKQIITEQITKLNQKVGAPSKEDDPASGESLIQPILLAAAKQHM